MERYSFFPNNSPITKLFTVYPITNNPISTLSKIKKDLNWHPKWSILETLNNVLAWYEAFYSGKNMLELTINQIRQFEDWKN